LIVLLQHVQVSDFYYHAFRHFSLRLGTLPKLLKLIETGGLMTEFDLDLAQRETHAASFAIKQ